jgi:hypothetical protein
MCLLAVFFCTGSDPFVQSRRNTGNTELPLRRIRLYSSGVAYFEHQGTLNGSAEILLPFSQDAVNDALKSLVIRDPASTASQSPSARYSSADTLFRSLRSLRIDLSGNPGIAEILEALRGAELEISGPKPLRGRLISVERHLLLEGTEVFLLLSTAEGIRRITLGDVSFTFTDANLQADLNRALDILAEVHNSEMKELIISLPGTGNRNVSLSYVIPAPVWKVSYRLDLGGTRPLLQGWAIVDSGGDTDWNNVELSLVTGRPVSFVQNLYPPYYPTRPTLPLSIAGIAQAETYDSGWMATAQAATAQADAAQAQADAGTVLTRKSAPAIAYDDFVRSVGGGAQQQAEPVPSGSRASLTGGIEIAQAETAGDQFEFTFKRPVTLSRRQSAMLPLTETFLDAEKTLVFSGARAIAAGKPINPAISAELTNTTGMKLPAGPITVFDGGAYAGDALIGFFPENEKRLISYGDDLSVSGSVTASSSRIISAVTVSGGVMVITRKQSYEKIYTLRNASGEEKRLILEHPVTVGTNLAEPDSFAERTDRVYRFARVLPAGRAFTLTVREELPLSERIVLAQFRPETFVSYISNQDIPLPVRSALQKAAELKRKTEDAKQIQTDTESRRERLIAEQDRIRRNLEAAGRDSPQGQDYLRRLGIQDAEIDALTAQIATEGERVRAAQQEYDAYLASLNL